MINQTLPFAEWAPDLADIGTGTNAAKNVIPHKGSYLQMPSLAVTSDALTAYCRGAVSFQDKDGNVESYAGDATKLYRIASQAWADKSGATYTTGTKDFWRFIKWGERVIATNFADAIQTKAFGSGTNFADLGGSPPKAKCIAVVRSFIVLGNIDDGTHYPNKLQWSGQNLETSWGTNPATQADSQLLAGDGGAVQAIMGGGVGVIVQERSIQEMHYQGPPVVFSIRETAPGVGTPAPQSVVQYGNVIYFLGHDGFYQYVVGQGPSPIGDKKIDRWFLNRVNKDDYHRMVGAVDVPNGKIFWAYPTGAGDPNEMLIYDYKTGQWACVETDVETIYAGRAEGLDIDSFDGAGYTNIDTVPASLDSDTWKGGSLALYGADTSHKTGAFNGPALTSRLETIEMSRDDAQIIYINSLRPLVQGEEATNTVYVGSRNSLSDPTVYGSGIAANAIGEHNTRNASRYVRLRCDTAGGFEHAAGIRVAAQVNGNR